MAGFRFTLETEDGRQAEPLERSTAVPSRRPGATIPLGARTLRVVAVRDDDAREALSVR